MLVRHLDDNPEDNRLENLAYGTPAENGADAVRHGRNVQANQTHCVNGHPFDEENTLRVNGRRKCRRCHMLVIWRKRNKEPDSPPRKRAPKTRCPRGHEYTPENTYTSPDGRRQCRACIRLRQERRKAA